MNGTTLVNGICGSGKQSIPKGSPVPELAQLYAYGLFRADFRSRYPAGATYHDWDIIQGNVASGSSVIDRAARRIRMDMRNYTSQSARSRAQARAGQFSKLREGRELRGDGIGLAIDPARRACVCELLEVTTIDDAQDCITGDLVPKLALLRGPVKKILDSELAQLRLNASMVPQEFVASGTPWIIPPPLSIVPLFLKTDSIEAGTYRWICFAPTYLYRPYPLPSLLGTSPEPETAPARGLILYSYHEAKTGAIPVEVVKRFAQWLRQRPRAANDPFGLLPTSAVDQYWRTNTKDLQELLGFLALGILAVGVVALAIYLAPILFPAEGALLIEAGAATSAGLIARGATMVNSFATALPATLVTTQTAISSAINIGGGLTQITPGR